MKKNIFKLILIVILSGCDNEQKLDLESLKKTSDLKLIQQKKSILTDEMNKIQNQLKVLDNLIFKLDKNQKYTIVNTKQLTLKPFKHFIEIQGSVKSDKNLVLYPEIPGIIKSIKFKEGDRVAKGSTLVEFSNTGIQALLEQLELKLNLAKTTYQRQLNLWNEKIGSEIQFLKAKTDYLSVEKEIIQAKDKLAKSKIIAPFDGIIDHIIAENGSNVIPGMTPVLRIINLDKVKVVAEVPEIHLSNIKKGAEVEVYFPVISRKFPAKVSLVGNFINPSNRNFRVETLIENKNHGLKPNMTAKISVNDYYNPAAIMINRKDIFENSNSKYFVYKINSIPGEDKKYKVVKTEVKLGKSSKTKVEIIEGLKSSDTLILDGNRMVKNNQIVRIKHNSPIQ